MLLQPSYRFFSRSIFSFLFLASINVGVTQAQVVPDGTLPTKVEQLEMIRKITGGERVGDNLFHSFEQFSIPAGMEAIFENAPDIQNIFTRITGSEISFIDGLLKIAGGANFFLVNPNGIVFGENAQIDVGGSFIATTANSIEFADGTSFIASGDESKVTLSIEVPIGLGFGSNNGSITVNGSGNQITNDSIFAPIEFGQTPSGISANDGNTIALVGNGINLNGGVITTEGGNIYLTSVASGSVGISQEDNGLSLINNSVNNYQDITLNQQSLIDTNGEKVGKISLSGQNINLNNGSFVLARNQGNLSADSINIQASESLNLSGSSPDGEISSNIRSEAFNSGEGATIDISAAQLTIQDNGSIQASTFNNGLSGNLNFNVANSLKINSSSVSSLTFGAGNAGNINLSTSHLKITNEAFLTTSTFTTGNGGEVNINSNLIEVLGDPNRAEINTNGAGRNRASISASSFSNSQEQPGNAGSLNINTQQLRIKDGGVVSSSSFGTGNGGSISINASEAIEVSGREKVTGSNTPESSIRTAVQIGPSGRIVPTGTAGSLTINTPVLNVTQEGVITVGNQGTGSAGTLTINTDTLNLDESGSITAAAESGLGGEIFLNTQNLNITNDSQISATAGGEGDGGNITITTTNLTAKKNNNITASAAEGEGGNITINADNSLSLNNQDEIAATSISADGGNISLTTDKLQINNNSRISTSAQGLGNGGNININTDVFTALNSSEVTANAVRGNGGNININTEGYFVSDDFVIDASSELGLDGIITINALDNDFQKDLEQSSIDFAVVELNFAESCLVRSNRQRRSFVVGGTGGFPLSPDSEYSDTNQTLTGIGSLPSGTNLSPKSSEFEFEDDTDWQPGDPIIPADKMIVTEDGRTLLVASPQKAKDLICQAN